MSGADPMSVRASRVRWATVLAASASLAATPSPSSALSVQEALLLALPAVALVSAEVKASVTVNCGRGPITISPRPFIEVGTGWFVDGRGYLITNAHVIDPAYRVPPWVAFDLKLRAVEEGCVKPALRAQGLMPGQRPDLEEEMLRAIPIASVNLTPTARVSVLLSNGANLEAQIAKFSAPITLDAKGSPLKGSGRDLALLKIQDGTYPALSITDKEPKVGDELRILGFPGVVRDHELLSRSALKEASATKGEVSGFNTDAIGQDVIQTDAAAVHGNSGGPAVDDNGSVVGVMTFISLRGEAAVQGFNFLIPARDVRAFLVGTDVKPGESRFNPVWAAGVAALFDERYSVALAKFREADGLLPGLVVVKRSMREAGDKLAHPPARPFPWAWTIAGALALLSVVTWGVWGARRWKRNRYRVHPGQVVDFLERGLNPVLLDVRVPADYETSPLSIPKAIRLDPEHITRGAHRLGGRQESAHRHVLHEPGRANERAGRPAPAPRGVEQCPDPQGRSRRVGERAPARGEQISPALDRDRDLPEPHARRHRAASLRAGRGHLRGGRRRARRGIRRSRGHVEIVKRISPAVSAGSTW